MIEDIPEDGNSEGAISDTEEVGMAHAYSNFTFTLLHAAYMLNLDLPSAQR